MPTYDRVDGLALPFGPTIGIGDDRVTIDPVLTYRSQLGALDPSMAVAWHPTQVVSVSVSGTRGTFTNDAWIRSDLMNSLYAFGLGYDARNYFRGDRAEGKIQVNLPMGGALTSLYLGARMENAWSTGLRPGARGAPYSVFNERDTVNGMERPNPLITEGHIASALLGGEGSYDGERVTNAGRFFVEGAWHTPTTKNFQQITVHDEGVIRTWGGEKLEFTVHGVAPLSGTVPAQRYVYVGGSGTLATIDLLSLGGDHLYYTEELYDIPIPGISLPIVGAFFVAPHFVAGAAGVGGVGVPTQNIGVRVGDEILRVDYLVNPRTHKSDFSIGLGFSR